MTNEPTDIDEISTTLFRVIYGNPGSGKTTLAARLGESNLFITDERGIVALNKFPELKKCSKYLRFDGLNPIKDSAIKIHKGEWHFDHIILDTLTGMQTERIQEQIPMLTKRGTERKVHPELPVWDDWNLSLAQWRPLIKLLANCGINVTALCHLRAPGTPRKPGETVRPDLTEKVFQQVNRYANVVLLLEQDDKGRRIITTQGNNLLSVKCQIDVPGAKITDEQYIEADYKHRNP